MKLLDFDFARVVLSVFFMCDLVVSQSILCNYVNVCVCVCVGDEMNHNNIYSEDRKVL